MPSPAAEAVVREARLSVAYALCGSAPSRPAVLGQFGVAARPRLAAGAGLAVVDARLPVAWAPTPAPASAVPPPALPHLASWKIIRSSAAGRPAPAMPEPGFIPLDFHCQNVRGSAIHRPEWHAPEIPPLRPPFALRPVLDRLEELVPRKAAPRRDGPGSASMHQLVETIAASLFVAVGMWFGIGAARTASHIAAVNAAAHSATVADGSTRAAAPAPAETASADPAPLTRAAKGPLAWVRGAVSRRAAVELTDTFHSGMEAWGAAPKTWAQGWSRHPDGYVRTGQLALYRPSEVYSDYRLEFFAQIESRSVGWAVRARDLQNYYAMKFTIIEPGLRPIIAMVHYAVVGGKKGRAVEVPLSVMVHNNTPYHVAVEVRGNRVITSIEGQEVDRWIDDTLASGGVGFFSEAGERARLYWMRLAANNDFLGRICAYLSGRSEEGSQITARLWWMESPAETPQPGPGGTPPGHPEDMVLAAAGIRLRDFRSWRIPSWGLPRGESRAMRDRCLPA